MDKNCYMISEAADLIHVEAHVLRYWEEELELEIPRNEMGHRYYTRENIQQFQKVKELKENGFQLKAIKNLVQSMREDHEEYELAFRKDTVNEQKHSGHVVAPGNTPVTENYQRMEQFQLLMNNIVKNAMKENNRILGEEIKERVLKEMNYLMRIQEEQEEERYKRLDEAIRSRQKKGILLKKEKKKKEKHRPKETILHPKLN